MKTFILKIENQKPYPRWKSAEGYKLISTGSREEAMERFNDPTLERTVTIVAEAETLTEALTILDKISNANFVQEQVSTNQHYENGIPQF